MHSGSPWAKIMGKPAGIVPADRSKGKTMRRFIANHVASIAVIAGLLCGSLVPAAPRLAAAAEKDVYRTLPAGASIVGILQSTVSTKRNRVGDPVRLRTAHPIRQGGK